MCRIVSLILLGIVTWAIQTTAAADSIEAFEPATVHLEWPAELRGQVVNDQQKPVAGASVTVSLTSNVCRSVGGVLQVTRPLGETTSDEEGRYEFSSTDFPEGAPTAFGVTITAEAEGYASWESWSFFDFKDQGNVTQRISETLPDVQLASRRTVRGVCVNDDGKPVAGAVLRGYESKRQFRWANALFETDSMGRFEFVAPHGDGVGVWVASSQSAPQFVLLPDNDQPLHIELQRGTVITGTVSGLAGEPLANAVVVAESMDSGKLASYSLPFERVSRTDAAGRFRLNPVAGVQRLYVTEAGRATDRPVDNYMRSDLPLPPIPPRFLKVDSKPRIEVTFQAGKTAVISGTVTLADETPVEGAEVRTGLTPTGNGGWIQFADAYTDANGRYSVTVPIPLQEVGLQVLQYSHKEFENTAKPFGWGEANSPRVQPVIDDVPRCDFVFSRRAPR